MDSVTGIRNEEKRAMANLAWYRDPDEGLRAAQETGKMVLLDFSAAPM